MAVASLLQDKGEELKEKRYQMLGPLLAETRKRLRWANPVAVKEAVDSQMLALLGPKDERDDLKKLVCLVIDIRY